MSYRLGIDLGTTYTAAAIHRDGRASMASLGDSGAALPSVVWLEDDQLLTGTAAVRRGVSDPDNVAREFKRRVGDPAPLLIGGSPYSAEQLSAKLLRWVVDSVTTLEGEPPELVALSHPANWGPYKQELLAQAIRMAEIRNAVTLTEPQAAAIHYASNQRMKPGQIVAVYDLGGGTFDAAILAKTDTGFEILGEPEGIERLGGIDFDAAVFGFVADHLDGALDAVPEDDEDWLAALMRLREECTKAKEALSSDTEATIEAWLPTGRKEVRITREEFEKLIRPPLRETVRALRRALETAQITPPDVDAVLLVGGSSRIPMIGQMVTEELGRPVAVDAHPKHAIALGAAIFAASAGADAADAPPADTSITVAPVVEEEVAARHAAAEDREGQRADVLQSAIDLALELNRSDLADRLRSRAAAGDGRSVRVLLIGDYKAGKSSLLNALVEQDVCPVDADMATIVPTAVRFSSEPLARVYIDADGPDEDNEEVQVHDVPVPEIADYITKVVREDGSYVTSCEIGIDSPILAKGITLVDLPGAGGLDSHFGAQALVELATCDAVVFVSSAAQELTQPELDLLKAAVKLVPRVVYALTKVDYYPEWRRIRELDAGHLLRSEIQVEIHPVSSMLVSLARRLGDETFIAESGLRQLTEVLVHQAEAVRDTENAALANEIANALGQLQGVAMAERSALDPESIGRVLADLKRAYEEAEDLRLESAEWHRVLRDGVEDLRRMVEEQLESKVQRLTEDADEVINSSDPADTWDELMIWVQRSASWMVTAMFEALTEQAGALKREVAQRLAESETDLLDEGETRSSPWLGALKLDRFKPDFDDEGRSMHALSAGWSVTEPALGLGAVLPFMSGIGLVVGAVGALAFGRKALRQRKERQIASRREQAHEQTVTYFQDASRLIARELDKAITQLYRHVRDHAYERAEELERSLGDALDAAQRQKTRSESERADDAVILDARLEQIEELIDRARALLNAVPTHV